MRLELDQELDAQFFGPFDIGVKGRNGGLQAVLVHGQALHFRQRHVLNPAVNASQALEIVVVHDHKLQILGQQNIHLYLVYPLGSRRFQGWDSILYSFGHIAPMGHNLLFSVKSTAKDFKGRRAIGHGAQQDEQEVEAPTTFALGLG